MREKEGREGLDEDKMEFIVSEKMEQRRGRKGLEMGGKEGMEGKMEENEMELKSRTESSGRGEDSTWEESK